MRIDSLITVLSRDDKPLPLMADQFDFAIDRAGRKVARPLADFLAKKELVRVQTQRPYQLTMTLDLPDASTGKLRPIQCQLTLDGMVDRTPDAARAFVEAALQSDFDLPGLAKRLLERALSELGASLQPAGNFVAMLRAPQGPQQLQARLLDALRTAQLGATRLTLTPLASDTRPTLALEDEANTLEVRPCDQLAVQRVGYKARLAWGKDDAHVLGRLSYRGKIEGRTAGSALATVLVNGQIQPLEAWFRMLLAEALSQQTWADICCADEAAIDQVVQEVSHKLGTGTGRVLQALKVYPTLGDTASATEKSTRFRQSYPISGMDGTGLEIDHAVRHALVDHSRWQAAGSPDPQVFLQTQVIEATRLFLLDMRFERIVALYLGGSAGEQKLSEDIARRVAPAAAAIGHSFAPVATILTIPQSDFVHGRSLVFPERSFALATANVSPAITIHAPVRVRQRDDGGAVFARAMARVDDFEDRVRATIEGIVREHLRRVEALQYYGSDYVNSVGVVQDAETGKWVKSPRGEQPFQLELRQAIDQALADRFGLETTDFDLVAGEDRLISRMQQLSRLPIRHEEDLVFERGGRKTAVHVHAHATLFVASIDAQQWDSFYANTMRLSEEEHRQKVVQTLSDVLRLLERVVTDPGSADMIDGGVKALIVQWFTQRMSEELGLVVRLRPLLLHIRRPRVGQVGDLIVESLEQELRKLLEQRANLEEEPVRGYGKPVTREALTARITQVQDDLKVAAARHEAELAQTHVILIEQHPITGALLAGPSVASGDSQLSKANDRQALT